MALLLTFQNFVRIRLVALPHPEDHRKRNVTHCNDMAREQSAQEQFRDAARQEVAKIIDESRPTYTLLLSPQALPHAMKTSLVSVTSEMSRGKAEFRGICSWC